MLHIIHSIVNLVTFLNLVGEEGFPTIILYFKLNHHKIAMMLICMCGSRGWIGGPDPPGKSQVILVSIEISILTPLAKVGPPWKMSDPLWIIGKV